LHGSPAGRRPEGYSTSRYTESTPRGDESGPRGTTLGGRIRSRAGLGGYWTRSTPSGRIPSLGPGARWLPSETAGRAALSRRPAVTAFDEPVRPDPGSFRVADPPQASEEPPRFSADLVRYCCTLTTQSCRDVRPSETLSSTFFQRFRSSCGRKYQYWRFHRADSVEPDGLRDHLLSERFRSQRDGRGRRAVVGPSRSRRMHVARTPPGATEGCIPDIVNNYRMETRRFERRE
jgi:hypothetical protein